MYCRKPQPILQAGKAAYILRGTLLLFMLFPNSHEPANGGAQCSA